MNTGFSNRLSRIVNKINTYPSWLRCKLLTLAVGRAVKYVGTSAIQFKELSDRQVVVSLKNKTKVQNHIGQIHAAAMILLAETATGLVVGMNVAEQSVPVIKSIKTDFKKRTQGAMRAVATLTQEQIALIRSTDKGETAVEVHVTDQSGAEPIICEMIWAWTPKRKN